MPIIYDKRSLFRTESSESVENALKGGDEVLAFEREQDKKKKLYRDQMERNTAAVLEAAENEASLENIQYIKQLTAERKQLLKVQEMVEDYETINNQWVNNKVEFLRNRYGKKDIPPEELERVYNIKNEADARGLSLRVSRAEQRISNEFLADRSRIASLIEDRQYSQALTESEMSIGRIRALESEGYFTPQQARNEIESLRETNAEKIVAGSVADTTEIMGQEGFDAAEAYWREAKGALEPYIKKSTPQLQALIDKQDRLFKAGRDDSDFRYKTLQSSFESGLRKKYMGFSGLEANRRQARGIIYSKLKDPFIKPKDKTALNDNLKVIRGQEAAIKGFKRAVEGDPRYRKMMTGELSPPQIIELLGLKNSSAVDGAAYVYTQLRSGYDWKKDRYHAIYHFDRDLRGEGEGPRDVISLARDQAQTAVKYGLQPGVSNQVQEDIEKIFNMPDTAQTSQVKQGIIGLQQNTGLNFADGVNKRHLQQFSPTVISAGMRVNGVLPNINFGSLADIEAAKSRLQNRPGAKQNILKIANAVDQIGEGGVDLSWLPFSGVENLESIARAYNVDEGALEYAIAWDFMNYIATSGQGGISENQLDFLSGQELAQHDVFQNYMEDRLKAFAGSYKEKQGSYFFTDEADPFQDKKGPNLLKYQSLGLPYRERFQRIIQDVTGLKDLNVLENLRFANNSDLSGYFLQKEDKYGRRMDLFYKGSQGTKRLFLSKNKARLLMTGKSLTAAEQIDLLEAVLIQGAED